MTQEEIQAGLKSIFKDVFARDDLCITMETSAKDIEGWDSLRMINIVLATMEKFKIKLKSREIDRLKNVGDLVKVIEERLNG